MSLCPICGAYWDCGHPQPTELSTTDAFYTLGGTSDSWVASAGDGEASGMALVNPDGSIEIKESSEDDNIYLMGGRA